MTAAGMGEDDVASVVRLTQAFTRSLSSSLLNISIAKIGIEGGNHVQTVAKEKEAGAHSSVSRRRINT